MQPTAPLRKRASSLKVREHEKRRHEALLRVHLRNGARQAERVGFRPKSFRMLLADIGPVETCVRLITSKTVPDGFLVLWEKDRLDLTAEAAVLAGPWKALFPVPVLTRAKERLKQYGRPDLIPAG